MIHKLTFSNFFSFEEETEVSFILDGRVPENSLSMDSPSTGRRISKVMAVFGANGSGKTNLMKPFVFLPWFMANSFRQEPDAHIPLDSHFFQKRSSSSFVLEFEADLGEGPVLLLYKAELTRQRVLMEELYQKTDSTRFTMRYLFKRHWDDASQSYQVQQKGFGMSPKEAEKVRQNASLISTAAQYDVPIARALVRHIQENQTNVNSYGREYRNDILASAEFYFTHEQYRERMANLLVKWDFGLDNVVIKEEQRINAAGQQEKFYMPYGVHQHIELPLFAESSGTQGAYLLLSRLLPVLEAGGVAVIDEMESDLHPHMMVPILDLFFSKHTNPKNAQLVFTSHSIEVMNRLQKGQIMLVEKDEVYCSHAWSLVEMNVRPDDNFYGKYMAGAYGGVPNL